MARLLFPDEGSRLAYGVRGSDLRAVANSTATLYTDPAGTILADIRSYDGTLTPGPVIPGSVVTTDAYSRLPLFWGPDAVDTVYAILSGGPPSPVFARFDPRIDQIETDLADKAPLNATARFNPAGKPNGTITVLDTGQPVTNFGNSPISVVSGKLQHFPAASPQQAGYIQLNAGARVHRVGMMAAWQPNSTGAIAMVVPSLPWSQGVLPIAGIHLVMFGNGIWHCSRWNNGETIYADYTTNGRYATVWDGIARPIDLWIDTDTATCTLYFPDGTSTTFSNPAVSADTANYAIWELYETAGSVDVAATIGEIWADTYTPAESAVGLTKPEASAIASSAKRIIHEYTTAGTFSGTIPDSAQGVLVTLVAAPGGGGSGRQGAAGTVRNGGSSGGSGGIIYEQWIPKVSLVGSYSVIVPAGGIGGAAVSTPDTNGNPGASGAVASFNCGVFLRALGGGGGPGGTAIAGIGGGAGAPLSVGGVPPSTTGGVGTTGSASNNGAAGIPGAGGGITSGDVPNNGGAGSASNLWSSTGVGGLGGIVDSTVPGQGAVAVAGRPGDGPGGGAASITSAAQAGANARGYAAAGAGGGASLNGNNSGKGGDGFTGYARVTIVTL